MAQNNMMSNSKESFLKLSTETIPRQRTFFILKVLSILSAICLLLLFYEVPDILGKAKSNLALKFDTKNSEKCNFDEKVIRRVKFPFGGIAVEVSCQFLDRIRVFNVALDHLRSAHLKEHSDEWQNISASEKIRFIGGADDNFLQQLENFSQVQTVFLPWLRRPNNERVWTSFKDTSNILINKYLQWTADEELCQWIRSPNLVMCDYIHNRTCISDIRKTKIEQSLRRPALMFNPIWRESYLRAKARISPPEYYQEPPPVAFYLHLIHDSIVTSNSEVWSGDMYLVPRTCSYRTNLEPPQDIDKIPLYDEVIALSQYWGEGTFHAMIEVIPRLSLYVDFLRRNPQIKILVANTRGRAVELLTLLGLSKQRVIIGTCRAKLLYLPRSTKCGCANAQEIQFISFLFRNYISENLKTESRNKVILVRRSGSRRFAEHESIERMVEEAATKHNFSFASFPDNPVPPLNKTLVMFHSAVMIIAPHGAGLSNVVFSQPGTYVIEGVCNQPHINMCYQRLVNILGHQWHGSYSQNGCMDFLNVSISTLKATVDRHLEVLKK